MSKEIIEDTQVLKELSRRGFLNGVGAIGAGFLAGSILSGCGSGSRAQSGSTDMDTAILNFALNLEYLEAEFYTYATTGSGIANAGIGITGTGTAGATTGGVQTTFTDATTQAIAEELTADEQSHVTFLRGALQAQAVAKPAINLAALGSFASQTVFLTLARAFEDTGVSAYGGAASSITNKGYLQAAAQIMGTEALHAGNIRLLIKMQNITVGATDSLDVPPPPGGTQYFTTTTPANSALAIIRTTTQVLNIVYAGGTGSGGFYPAGMNGTIH